MKVSHVMRMPVTTVEPKETVHIAEGIMALGGFRHLPVVVDGELVGIVTDRDLLRAPAVLTHLHGIDDTRAAGRALRVEDLMSKPVVTVGPETALAEAADPAKAPAMQAYMKSAMPYYGVAMPGQQVIWKKLFRSTAMPDACSWRETILSIWCRTAAPQH